MQTNEREGLRNKAGNTTILAFPGEPTGQRPLCSILISEVCEISQTIAIAITDASVPHQARPVPRHCAGTLSYGIPWNVLNTPREQALLSPLFDRNGGSESFDSFPEAIEDQPAEMVTDAFLFG